MQPIPASPSITLYQALLSARHLYLHPALNAAVAAVGVAQIDSELQQLVPAAALTQVASLGLRGERVFPVPALLTHSPALIGYYRMLLGLSRKDFTDKLGYGPWLTAETEANLRPRQAAQLSDFCKMLIAPLTVLVQAMGQFEDRDLSDLALLTLGPTLQGGRNNDIGRKAATKIFEAARAALDPEWITFEPTDTLLRVTMPDGAIYELAVAGDPDLAVRRGIGTASLPLLAIEIKGGGDRRNAHNRAGEAEKSHVKAAIAGYPHRWTVIQLAGVSRTKIQTETPSSTAVFEFSEVSAQQGIDWIAFRTQLRSLLGITR